MYYGNALWSSTCDLFADATYSYYRKQIPYISDSTYNPKIKIN